MKRRKLYHIAGVHVQIPLVDPVGCDVLFWELANEYYFAEIRNGRIYHVNDGMLWALISKWSSYRVMGILNAGVVGKIMPNRLQ